MTTDDKRPKSLQGPAGGAKVSDRAVDATTATTLGGSGHYPEPPLFQPRLVCHRTSSSHKPALPDGGGADPHAVLRSPDSVPPSANADCFMLRARPRRPGVLCALIAGTPRIYAAADSTRR
jgi:hypothetical protein